MNQVMCCVSLLFCLVDSIKMIDFTLLCDLQVRQALLGHLRRTLTPCLAIHSALFSNITYRCMLQCYQNTWISWLLCFASSSQVSLKFTLTSSRYIGAAACMTQPCKIVASTLILYINLLFTNMVEY
jgi:hypothetical protein